MMIGSTCPMSAKAKINATKIFFGALAFVIALYTGLRNICTKSFE